MGQIFNTKVITNVLDVEEKILDSMKKISKCRDFSDIDLYNNEIDKIKLYYKKEKLLISKIPDNVNFYNYLFELLNNSSFDIKNDKIVVSRFRNILYNKYLTLKPEYETANVFDDDVFYDNNLDLKVKAFIKDNLLIEYLKSFDIPMHESDNNFSFFNNIRLFNIYLNCNLFDFWIKNDFDFDRINYCLDKEAIKYFNISNDFYYNIFNDNVSELCSNLLKTIFSDVKRPKSNIIVQDSFFNFKFLIKKLSTDAVKAIKKEMDDVYISVGKYGLLSEVIDAVDSELKIVTM